jgi:hypothetical protein
MTPYSASARRRRYGHPSLGIRQRMLEAQPRLRGLCGPFSVRVDASVSASEPRTPAQAEEQKPRCGRTALLLSALKR